MSLLSSAMSAASGAVSGALSAGLAAALQSAPALLTYDALRTKYNEFSLPRSVIEFNGKPFEAGNIIVTDINVEATCGFEASVARFRLYNVFSPATGKFQYDLIQNDVTLGSALTIKLGYLSALSVVFVGFVANISFGFDPTDLPYIEITGMDAKGLMMASSYAAQLTAKSYGEAVSEILGRTAYEKLRTTGAVTSVNVTDTPDKKSGPTGGNGLGGGSKASAETIEMVEESDYEFVVKAAKKFNYEFFVDRGAIYFRKARSTNTVLMELGVGKGLLGFEVNYTLTGLVGSVEVRAMNPDTGKAISSVKQLTANISTGTRAKPLISGAKKVYIDPTVTSQEQADARASYLADEISYRLGTLECSCPGIPDLAPGQFVRVSGLGSPIDNIFYVTSVTHDFRSESGYQTKLIAKASEVKK